jgi:hypothetical protein
MLERYSSLKDTLTQQGYDQALKLVEELPARNSLEVLLKTNFYCYLTISCEHESSRCLTILQECLAHPECSGGVRALTRYHLCQLFFGCDIEACGRECEEVIGEFIGSYHMLQSSAERTPREEEELWLLQYVLYYCLMMLGYLRRGQGRAVESESYLQASQSLLRIGNRSSQLINASSLRTRSAEDKRRPPQGVQ